MWGALAMTRALFVAHCPSSVIHRVLSVSTITTRNNEAIKSIFSAKIYHIPGLCLLSIGGAPYITHKLWLEKHIFTFSTRGGTSYHTRKLLKPRPS